MGEIFFFFLEKKIFFVRKTISGENVFFVFKKNWKKLFRRKKIIFLKIFGFFFCGRKIFFKKIFLSAKKFF